MDHPDMMFLRTEGPKDEEVLSQLWTTWLYKPQMQTVKSGAKTFNGCGRRLWMVPFVFTHVSRLDTDLRRQNLRPNPFFRG